MVDKSRRGFLGAIGAAIGAPAATKIAKVMATEGMAANPIPSSDALKRVDWGRKTAERALHWGHPRVKELQELQRFWENKRVARNSVKIHGPLPEFQAMKSWSMATKIRASVDLLMEEQNSSILTAISLEIWDYVEGRKK